MKSKYASLVKLKKKELDKCERDLIAANNRLTHTTTLLDEAYLLLKSLVLPHAGSIGEFTQVQMLIDAQHQEIERCALNLEMAKQHLDRMQHQFKAAMIEYEKFNYLELQELEAYNAKIKKEEAKMLDEIGVITYKREPI